MKGRGLAYFVGLVATAGGTIAFDSTIWQVRAEQSRIGGGWSGSGTVNLSNGKTEKARCRTTFRPSSGNSYSMSAVCATASARVNQTARVRGDGPNSWSGEFFNPQYNVNGSIRIVLQGSTLRASLNGGGASAFITMTR